jgi:4-alpha-glucanotransferase
VAEKFHFVLLIHAHQPIGNFGSVLARAYQDCYLPFVECLEKHPGVRLGLHISGLLLEWIEEAKPEYFERLRALTERGQVELVGSGFYEPILVSIPAADQQEQIARMAAYLERHFGRRPQGAWLAERVWEPQLPSALAAAGVGYTLVDDGHFLCAGFEPGELFGDYVAEDLGQSVRLLPGLKVLRYLIPFRPVEEVIAFLRETASAHPGGMAAMGDDCEKFGVWPGTHAHCYRDGWLEGFFKALEANAEWLEVSAPGEYLASHAPLGRADLPAASYSEMMEWVLPTRTRERLHAVQKEFQSRPDVTAFLRGGAWRGFFRKYAEANLLHKKMLRVSAKLAASPRRRRAPRGKAGAAKELEQARTHLLRAQCNDAYWHGIFGGLYAPHLRTALWRELIRAEAIADRHSPGGQLARSEAMDFDADGATELVFSAPQYQALLKPSDGATLASLDFRAAPATLINSVMRRREEYHARLAEAARSGSAGVASIHEQTRVKEPGLERFLQYDRWARHAFRVMLFDPSRTPADYAALRLGEDAWFAGGEYAVRKSEAHGAELVCEDAHFGLSGGAAPVVLTVTKRFSFRPAPRGFQVSCEIGLKFKQPPALPLAVGLESVINLLAPAEPDRFFKTPEGRKPLRWSGVVPGPRLRMEDGWQRVRVALRAPGAKEFWIAPIETVSESEEGFERVYQGSQILAVWHPALVPQKTWSARLVWDIKTF